MTPGRKGIGNQRKARKIRKTRKTAKDNNTALSRGPILRMCKWPDDEIIVFISELVMYLFLKKEQNSTL